MPVAISTGTALALGATAISAGTAAYGAYSAGQAGAASAKYRAAVARNNAILAGQNATSALQQGEAKAGALAVQGDQKVGALRAGLGANGVALDRGSALGVQRDLAAANDLTVQNALYSADLSASGYLNQSSNSSAQAQLDKSEAANDAAAGYLGIATSLASGASTVASKWPQFKNPAPVAPASGGLY